MEILPVTNQYSVGFNSDKAWNTQWTTPPTPAGDVDSEAGRLAARLERELRAAKGASELAAAEVLVPAELLARVARQALALAEREPCGVRGATVLVDVAGRKLAAFKVDPHSVSTHELHLQLQHDTANWTSMLPQFLKNLTRGGTIIISPQFTLSKKKLFRSNQAE